MNFMGAALYSYYTNGVLKAEGSSITEGIGQGRITKNLEDAPIDVAYQIRDEEAVPVIFDLLEHEGLCMNEPIDLLRCHFDLTPAEARLALHLVAGETLRSAAVKLSITYETARSQLKNIFKKVGTHRQAELVMTNERPERFL